MERFEFSIKGSQEDPYAVIFEVQGTHAKAFCDCQAGQNGQSCKHRLAILAGDVTALRSGNSSDVGRLRDLLRGTDLATAYGRVEAAEAAANSAKRELDAAKKALAKAMHR